MHFDTSTDDFLRRIRRLEPSFCLSVFVFHPPRLCTEEGDLESLAHRTAPKWLSLLLKRVAENFRIVSHASTKTAMKLFLVKLTDDERASLQRMTTTGRVLAVKAARARILLKADEGLRDSEIAEHLSVGLATVERVRKRFVLEGMKAALEQRPQTNPRALKLDGEGEARLVQLACSEPPPGHRR